MSIWDRLARQGMALVQHAARKLQFQLPTHPAPAGWSDIVARNVPLARHLSDTERERLLRVARLFLEEVPIEGCAGLQLTEEIRVTIAATASLLVHRLPLPRFTKLDRVLVYPDAFLPRLASSLGDHTIDEPEATLGQAWMSGVVVLSWAAILRDRRESATGNVILHEMAHILDAEDGIFDGIPLHDDPDQGARWAQTLRREFEVHRAAVDAGKHAWLNDYAAANHAEFFAVATEAFFCTPDRLRKHLPDLSFQLGRFFGDERDA